MGWWVVLANCAGGADLLLSQHKPAQRVWAHTQHCRPRDTPPQVLTLNRIKTFIKEDAEVKSISTEACFAVARATVRAGAGAGHTLWAQPSLQAVCRRSVAGGSLDPVAAQKLGHLRALQKLGQLRVVQMLGQVCIPPARLLLRPPAGASVLTHIRCCPGPATGAVSGGHSGAGGAADAGGEAGGAGVQRRR